MFYQGDTLLCPPSSAVNFTGDETQVAFMVTWLGDLPGPCLTVGENFPALPL